MANCFYGADILLPKFRLDREKMYKWSTVACDQYTSEPEYWSRVEEIVKDSESAYRLIFPEIYLGDGDDARIEKINRTMDEYIDSVFDEFKDSVIYVERQLKSGKIRRGIVGKIDLEAYDFKSGADTLVRATEGTVMSRIPARVKIRRGAAIELPHIMMLIDDPECTVVELLGKKKSVFEKAYSFDLMQNGGHIDGFFADGESKRAVFEALDKLSEKGSVPKGKSPMLFAVGDGNHSLASAKALYEEIKSSIGAEAAMRHPARYALAEIVNIHDTSLEFEPIYRVVFNADAENLMEELRRYAAEDKQGTNSFEILCVSRDKEEKVTIEKTKSELAVGALQEFLDGYVSSHGCEIDYIHGIESTKKLADREGAVGFIFDGMKKSDLFRSVILNGSLPRKTFSMGEADDKRYYLEARKIR